MAKRRIVSVIKKQPIIVKVCKSKSEYESFAIKMYEDGYKYRDLNIITAKNSENRSCIVFIGVFEHK
jgi:hypothetical protein